ncbi:5556_t:CDS:1 [Funneliformis mosseae]|uniref:5556_t:CDS:1 n=1 Tax=Funneliformis mosseae TaxID=27381 RepID=A0A9N9F3A0_FUNMO|nr:5556_t:CDS:1 [Funneliformis mosseae]
MSFKHLTLIINVFIILVILLTTIDSNLLIIREVIDFTRCQGKGCCASLSDNVAKKHHVRVATIVIINKSGYNMTHIIKLEDGCYVRHDDHENLDINCEPQTEPLANGQNETFSCITSHRFGGLKGIATYIIDDSGSSTFILSWSIPTIGDPNYDIEGLPNKKYYNENKYDLDNTLY